MAAGQINIDPAAMEEAATWLRNQKEMMQQSLLEADQKMSDVVAAAYSTPGSETKFRPFWEEYHTSTRSAIEGLEGVSEFLRQVSEAFVSTDDQTSGAIG
ncbi:WXG100 family type VII secretion target [Streptomyces sp. ACA25]|uniref:WXG100 family type VII secretion target n=1 Tax=Streptomyces sp. ACA25 TaxID=3022596 RepID=UPI0023082237|nr:WXG100 family type VII secretion target [Streptomyces sp. ACA25]MDB1087113.1 WXG100 family type VII secretion target [Streptomyces sp. ACA25]